ncbi:MAG: hypothetical protein SNF68_03965 [Rikenellaceae bacterium]
MQTIEKTYTVAGHSFGLKMHKESALWNEISNLAPFEDSAVPQSYLFQMSSVESLESRRVNCRLIYEDNVGNTDFPRLNIYHVDGGNLIEMLDHNDCTSYGEVFISDDFKCGEYTLPQSNTPLQVELETLNLALTIQFTMASSPKNTLLFHSSCVLVGGRAYLFLGKSGTGKSTHSRMWREYFKESAELLNDDHPVVRVHPDGSVIAYGSPWSGQTACYKNLSAPVGAIVRIKRSPENRAKRLSTIQSYASLTASCSSIRWSRELCDSKDATLRKIIEHIDCYEMECLPNIDAAKVCAEAVTAAK